MGRMLMPVFSAVRGRARMCTTTPATSSAGGEVPAGRAHRQPRERHLKGCCYPTGRLLLCAWGKAMNAEASALTSPT